MKKYARQLMGPAVILGFAVGNVALAEDEAAGPAAAAGPSLSDILTTSGITASGYVAASYYHSSGYGTYHQFDNKHDSFQVDQASLTIAFQPKEGFGGLVDVAAGEDMKILNAAEGSNPNTFDIVQGFVQYATGPLSVIAGKYVTLAGAEVIAPTGNTNFSRSLLFFAEPLTHTGIRATYAATDTLSVAGGVNNGWNYSSLSTSGSKTAELGVAWTPSKGFALAAQAYAGAASYAPESPAQRPFSAEAHRYDPSMSGPFAGVVLPPWLQPFTMPEQVTGFREVRYPKQDVARKFVETELKSKPKMEFQVNRDVLQSLQAKDAELQESK